MKQIVPLLFLIHLFYGCNDKKETGNSHSNDHDGTFGLYYYLQNHMQHDITFQSAGYMGLDFLKDSARYADASAISYGGFLSKATIMGLFSDPINNQGLNLYMCYDDVAPALFLAYKHVYGYNPNDDSLSDPSEMLFRSNNPVRFSYTRPSGIDSVKKFLNTHDQTISDNNQDISASDVRGYANAFIDRYKDGSGNRYNQNHFMYLPYNEIDSIMRDASCGGMNYYLGFDETENINKIRIYFIAVKKTAPYDRIIKDSNNKYQMILERHWP